MNENLYDALEVCLQTVETGADIESALKRYPQMADELRPVLEASVQARTLAALSVPEAAMRRGRARVLQHAAGMRSAHTVRGSIFSFPRLAISLALALIFIFSGTGLVRASSGALPGDRLYPIKRTWEGMRLFLVFNPEGREELEGEFEQERLHEIDELLTEGRSEPIAFPGLVTEQTGDQWLVSGILVQITPGSILPVEPVTIGTSIIVEGHTNPQGFVQADRVEILKPGVSLPPIAPIEIGTPDSRDQNENSMMENNENTEQDETDILLEDNNDNGNDGDRIENSNDSSGNRNDNSNEDTGNDNDNDSNDDDNDSGGGDDSD